VTPQKRCLVVRTLAEAEEARNTSDVDVDQQLLIQSAGGDNFPDVPLPVVSLPGVPLTEACPDGTVGEQ